MNMIDRISAAMDDEYRLRLLAEECCELAQAALKCVRVMENQTPVTPAEATEKLMEEFADVEVAQQLLLSAMSDDEIDRIGRIRQEKTDRMAGRMKLDDGEI